MKMNLLISSCGRRVQLIDCFRRAAAELQFELKVTGCDADPDLSAAARKADAMAVMPRCSSERFIPELLALCERGKIDLVIPTIDPELPVLAGSYDEFRQRNCEVAISTPPVVAMAGDKLATSEWLRANGISTPGTWSMAVARENSRILGFPVMIKPVAGSGSVGVRYAETAVELYDVPAPRGFLVQSFINGREYTLNLYFSLADGKLRCAISHLRLETRGGEVSKGVTVRHPGLAEIARKIGGALQGARGCICVQVIEQADGQLFVTDINARFGGGYPLADYAGAKFARWLLEETAGLPCTADDNWKENITMLRYDAAVFL
jgi:carbamoyl-phosphate synthase large subunit